MASVQELIAAINAQKPISGAASALESFTGGLNRSISRDPSQGSLRLAQIRQAQQQTQQIKAEEERRKINEVKREESLQRARKIPGIKEQLSIGPKGTTSEFTVSKLDIPKTFKELFVRDVASGDRTLDEVLVDLKKLEGLKASKNEKENIDTALKLGKQFIDRPEVKDMIVVKSNVSSMDALLKSSKEGNLENQLALDQGLITMYNKITDPRSVVRESEYARTAENIPFVNRIIGAIQKIEQGGAGLTDEDREALVFGAKIIANERGKISNETRKGYIDLAGTLNIDPKLIVGTIPVFKAFDLTTNVDIPSGRGGAKIIKRTTVIK